MEASFDNYFDKYSAMRQRMKWAYSASVAAEANMSATANYYWTDCYTTTTTAAASPNWNAEQQSPPPTATLTTTAGSVQQQQQQQQPTTGK
jgi:hypothetical protein